MNKINIPQNSILGINYSGMHDSAVSIVSAKGEVVFSSSLERFSRIKQDGRFPKKLLELIPMENINKVAVSNEKEYTPLHYNRSIFLVHKLTNETVIDRSHQKIYYEQLNRIKKEKIFFSHHLSHASSSFYASGFKEAVCLVYDGGMANEQWFGGVYKANKNDISVIDRFSAQTYANITYIYTVVTALLGFTPVKHEGKITGLAALGIPKQECKDILLFG